MKNKVLIRVLVASLFAFMLYSASLRQMKTAKVNVVEPKSSKVVTKKQKKEPKLKAPATKPASSKSQLAKNVKVDKGSQTVLVKKIEQAMGDKGAYQVSVQDLNNSNRYARLGTTSSAHDANNVLRVLVLTTIYYQEQHGKIKPRANIKIKKSDRVKGEKLLQTNMQYGIAYLRQAMMKGNKTAANALLRKAGKKNVNLVADKLGATNTTVTGTFTKKPVGKTTARDLDLIMKGLYQGKVLNQQHAQIVLMAMHGSRTKLTKNITGTIYSVGDSHFSSALVQTSGHSYCISAWGQSQSNFSKLGKAVNTWFEKQR